MTKTLLEFPCPFSIKVFGNSNCDLMTIVHGIITPIYGPIALEAFTSKPSKQGKYQAITIAIEAQSQKQLDEIYLALSQAPQILMCL
jgi:uncharacterized protein